MRNDSQTAAFSPKVGPEHPEYKARVAEPTMGAIDNLPKKYRELVYRFGYPEIYRAWRAHWTVAQILAVAVGDTFEFKPSDPGINQSREGKYA